MRLLSNNDICIDKYVRYTVLAIEVEEKTKRTWSVWKAEYQFLIKNHTIKAIVISTLSERELSDCCPRRITHGNKQPVRTEWVNTVALFFFARDPTLRRKSRPPVPSSRADPWQTSTLRGCSVYKTVWYEHVDMLRRLDGLLILSTDKAKYFSKFRPSVVLRVSVSFALYCETNFERLLSCTLRRVKHFPLFFSFVE